MIKIFKALNRYIKTIINFFVRLLLGVVYFIFFLPFGILNALFTDFLGLKKSEPHWIPQEKIENIKEFLINQ
jgi:hypothetical protein